MPTNNYLQKHYEHILEKIDKYKQCIDQNKPLLQAALYCGKSLNREKILKLGRRVERRI